MTASAMHEWVAFFIPDLVPDGQGGKIEVPPSNLQYDTCAAVRQVSGTETYAGDQIAQRKTYEVIIRYDPAITAVYRVYWRDQFLNIVTVENVEMRDAWMKLTCSRNEKGQQ